MHNRTPHAKNNTSTRENHIKEKKRLFFLRKCIIRCHEHDHETIFHRLL